ncbi:hypothetical protein GCM10020295_22070 [Streptomyces cinereospinus]
MGGRFRVPGAPGGERREFGRTAAARRPDECENGGRAPGERGRLPHDGGPWGGRDGCLPAGPVRARLGRAVLRHRGGRQCEHPGEVQVRPVGGHRGRVAGEQVGQRAAPGGPQRHGQPPVAVAGVQPGREQGDHGSGGGVDDRPPGRPAARPQGVAPGRADRQLQHAVEAAQAVRGRVGRLRHRAQHPRLTPAAGGDPHVRAGLDAVPHGERQRLRGQALGGYEGEVALRQRGDRLGGHHTAALPGAQHQPGQSVDGLVAGEDGALAVGDDAGAAGRPAGSWMRTRTPSRGAVPGSRTAMAGPPAVPPSVCALTSTVGAG